MASINFYLHLILTLLLVTINSASKLNVPRVLLPIFSDFSTKFTLEAIEGGCYKWTTTRKDIIKITLIDENKDLRCSSKILVSTNTKDGARNLAVVLAENVHTEHILKCDVIVDVIHSLSVTTTTRELFLDEVPEAFLVNAFDIQGNEFSTLDDIEFEWAITSAGSKDAEVLRYLPFKDSPYDAAPYIQKLEDANKKGSMILLEGIKTGTGKVSVRLPYSDYKHVHSVEVVLSVIANLLLTPGEIYMMVGDTAYFKLYYVNSGRLDEIRLPSQQYFFEAEDSTIKVNKKTNEITADSLGKTHLFVRNSYARSDDAGNKLPSAVINVVKPAYMNLNVLPYKNWAILVGDQHEITIEIFSNTDHKLHLGPAVSIHTQIGDAFHVEERTRNGSWISGWGLKEARATILATLERTNIKAEAELLIFPRITIYPSEVILPWDPQVMPKYTVELVAKGGDGRFLWTTTDQTIGLVTQTGVVRTTTYGSFDTTAAMMRNHHNRQTARFSILPPIKLEIVEYVMEAEVGEYIYLHVAIYAEKPEHNGSFVPVSQCQNLPFQLKTSNNKFVFNKSEILTPTVGVSCGNLAMVAQEIGTTKVTVIYYQNGVDLEDSVTISAHKPLRLLQPNATIVLAVGSTINLVYSGGPRPLIGRQAEHERSAISEHDNVIQAEDVTDRHKLPEEDYAVVWVLCRKLGESSVKLLVSNAPTLPNCRSRGSAVVTKIVCGKPRSIQLEPDLNIGDPDACPMDLSSDRLVVPAYDSIDLDVVVRDDQGRAFLNFSSLSIEWVSKPAGGVKFKQTIGVSTKAEMIGSVEVYTKSQQTIMPVQKKGLIEVTASIMGYKVEMLKHFGIRPEWPEFIDEDDSLEDVHPMVKVLGLVLVEDTQLSPNFTIIFNQPKSKRWVNVLHGSGYVEVALNAENIAAVRYLEGTRQLEVTPLVPGDVIIEIKDLCVASKRNYVKVRVVSVGRIEAEMASKVQMNHCVDVIVRLYDEHDDLLEITEIEDLNIQPRFSKNIANIGLVEEKKEKSAKGELHYVLNGLEVGDTVLYFSYEDTPEVVQSVPIDLEVFAPLKLNPRNVTILIGAKLQLTVKGGPHDADIEFISHSKISECSSNGIVVGKMLGESKITARAIGLHDKTGNKIIYSEDTVEAHVIRMTGVRIAAPLTRFRVGTRVPAWVTGIPEQLTPLVLATFEDSSIEFDWVIGDPHLAAMNSVFSPVSISYKYTDRTLIRVTALQVGRTTLSVNVTMSGEKAKRPKVVFTASLELDIFEAFELIVPLGLMGRSLLMSRDSTIQVKTNLDNMNKIEYSMPDCNSSFLRIDETGLLKSYKTIGFGMLLITAIDENGLQQTLTFVVEVKPVHYMLLTVVSNWRIHLDSSLRVVPLGTEFELLPMFYDNLGIPFNAGPTKIKATTNRLDLIRIRHAAQNTSLQISTRKPGHTVVKAWTEGDDATADYVRIHVEEVLKPVVESLVFGDIICLYSPVVTRHLQVGHWVSNDPHSLMIAANEIGYVTGRTETTVSLTHPLHANVPMTLKILPVNQIGIVYDETFITNGNDGTEVPVGVVFKNSINPADKRNNLIQGWHCDQHSLQDIIPRPFHCRIKFEAHCASLEATDLWRVESHFKADFGQYQCVLISIGGNESEASTLRTNVTIWVETEVGENISQHLQVPFIPGVYAKSEVLIGEKHSGEFDVKGLDYVLEQIIVEPADSSIVFVDKGKMIDSDRRRYGVQLIDYHRKLADSEEAMGIVIKSPMTSQVYKIMVKVTNDFTDECTAWRSPMYRFVQQYKHALTIVISMIIIFVVTCYVYSCYMQPVMNVNIHPNRSLLGVHGAGNVVPRMQATSTPFRQQAPCMHTCVKCNKLNCSCSLRHNESPVYGDVSSFNTSPEIRRNRRFL